MQDYPKHKSPIKTPLRHGTRGSNILSFYIIVIKRRLSFFYKTRYATSIVILKPDLRSWRSCVLLVLIFMLYKT